MKKGFTLIELLVVISIIGILAAVVTVSFTAVQKQARDTTRKSDLAQYRNSLEMFANQNSGLYPTSKAVAPESRIRPSVLCATLGLVQNCPEDPKYVSDPDNYYYSYISNVGDPIYSAKATQYVLWAPLENVPSSPTYWVVCSNGKSGKATVTPSSSTCPALTL